MYNLSLHIEYLLLRHDCVVVPGFGAFINVRHPARFDASARTWLPMTREVRFNAALSHDDGLLASSYARKNEVPFEEGREILRRDIASLRETFGTDGEVTLGKLGIFRLDEDSQAVSFVPRQSAPQMAHSLGFAPASTSKMQFSVRRAYVIEKNVGENMVTVGSFTPDSGTQNKPVQADNSQTRKPRKFNTERNYYIPVNKVFARAAACVVLVAVAILALLPAGDTKQIDKASVIPVEKIIRNTAACIAPSEPMNDLERADVIPDQESEVGSGKAGKQTGRFHVIVATFRSPSEAEEFIRQNGGTGYDLEVVSSKTMSRVSAISSDDRARLQADMMSPEFSMRFGEAWIWEDTTR